ncbi:MAG: hypothetical protein PQJ58_02865 [Spirochaetales bacterium]|nr:hypothetical protein [Spirochaetales bacterium]
MTKAVKMTNAVKKKELKEKRKKISEFSLSERILIISTSIVAFGGFMFCAIMIILMNSIDY